MSRYCHGQACPSVLKLNVVSFTCLSFAFVLTDTFHVAASNDERRQQRSEGGGTGGMIRFKSVDWLG